MNPAQDQPYRYQNGINKPMSWVKWILQSNKPTGRFGNPVYARIDAPANRKGKAKLAAPSADLVTAETLTGEPITARLTHAPANGAPIGGLKVCAENGWFAARPSGTEDF